MGFSGTLENLGNVIDGIGDAIIIGGAQSAPFILLQRLSGRYDSKRKHHSHLRQPERKMKFKNDTITRTAPAGGTSAG